MWRNSSIAWISWRIPALCRQDLQCLLPSILAVSAVNQAHPFIIYFINPDPGRTVNIICPLAEMILNTHSHADHVGGNRVIQDRTGCKVYCPGIDRAFAENTAYFCIIVSPVTPSATNQTPSSVPNAAIEKECPSMRAILIPSGKIPPVSSPTHGYAPRCKSKQGKGI